MECVMCGDQAVVAEKVVMLPFPAAGENAYLVAHVSCLPGAAGVGENVVGYYLEGSAPFFVPRSAVVQFEPVEEDRDSEVAADVLRGWGGILRRKEEVEDGS